MLGWIKSKNFIYPKIFHQQSFNIIQISELKSEATKIPIVHFFSLSNRMLHLHKRRKLIMDADESNWWPKMWFLS